MLQRLNYNKTYKFDFRFLVNSSLQKTDVTTNASVLFNALFGAGFSMMFYNFVTTIFVDYYVLNISSVGFYQYKFSSINALFGGRFIFHVDNHYLKKYCKTDSVICEVSCGLERMKVYDAYSNENDVSIISPCIFVASFLDYKKIQLGCMLKFRFFGYIHDMELCRLVPGIIFRF